MHSESFYHLVCVDAAERAILQHVLLKSSLFTAGMKRCGGVRWRDSVYYRLCVLLPASSIPLISFTSSVPSLVVDFVCLDRISSFSVVRSESYGTFFLAYLLMNMIFLWTFAYCIVNLSVWVHASLFRDSHQGRNVSFSLSTASYKNLISF